MRFWSPLRYPGGKGQMYGTVLKILTKNNLLGSHYAEPFAGGAGIAIRLLFEEKVSTISINDYDRAIYAFWHCVLYETERFTKKILETPINVETWREQKTIQSYKETVGLFDLGFSTFYLNRTNRSGIIKAGPIGGFLQDKKYKIDCRYNKKRLVELIWKISEKKDRIFLYNLDGKAFIKEVQKNNIFLFIDPPYFKKGKDLYVNFFQFEDHEDLSLAVRKYLSDSSFIITYDCCNQIAELYTFLVSYLVDLKYSLCEKKIAKEMMFVSKNITV